MKKLFFIAAIASAVLVSCTKNDVAPSASDQQEITFANPVSHVVTKVELITGDYPTDEDYNFSVFADYHKSEYNSTDVTFTPYMRGSEGVDVAHSTVPIGTPNPVYNSYWTSSNPYYWPKDGYLTFAAYSPASTKGDAAITYDITNGVKIIGYEVKTDLSNQRDLMLSNRVVDQESTDMVYDDPTIIPTAYDGVQLTFNHVLSAIKFSVATDANYSTDGYTIKLSKLSIKNAYTKGDLTQFAGIDKHDVAKIADDTPRTVWSNVDTENMDGYDLTVPSPGTLSTEPRTFSDPDDADLVLLPQALDHTSETGNKVIAEVVYTVYHADMGADPDLNAIEYKSELELATTAVSTWDDGKRYIYNIKIGMDKVIFAPVVKDWANGGSVDL
jgi:hypothetical protein